MVWLCIGLPATADDADRHWSSRLESRLAGIDAGFSGEIGVYVKALSTGETLSWRADDDWYLASLIKVPVALTVWQRIDEGRMSLDDTLTLAQSDYVDGAGPTNWESPGTAMRIGELLDAMLTVSDNTATDMLIRKVGRDTVNRHVGELIDDGLGEITSLVDVRRHIYAELHPRAFGLGGMDFIELQKADDDRHRLDWLEQRIGVDRDAWAMTSLDLAYDAYYSRPLNSGRLDAFGRLLEALAGHQALSSRSTRQLLATMTRTSSGDDRLKAGLGSEVVLAHKTGTQRRRTCHAGIAMQAGQSSDEGVVIVACTRGESSLERSEAALRAVGLAIEASGVLLSPDGPSSRRE